MLIETILYELKRLLFILHCCNCTINIFKKQFKIKVKPLNSKLVFHIPHTVIEFSRQVVVWALHIFISVFFKQCCGTQVYSLKNVHKSFSFLQIKNKFWLEQSKEQETSVNSQPFLCLVPELQQFYFSASSHLMDRSVNVQELIPLW